MDYLQEVQLDQEYPTAREVAERLARDYGIVNYKGMPHEDFARSFLNFDLKVKKKGRLMLNQPKKLYVYENSKAILDFAERILPELEEKKIISICLPDIHFRGKEILWRLYWKDYVSLYRKTPKKEARQLLYRGVIKKNDMDDSKTIA